MVLVGIVGCGGGKGDVSGKVTVDGKPLPMGNVVFIPTGGGPAVSAPLDAEGHYTAYGVLSGENKVSLDLAAIKSSSAGSGPKTGSEAMAARFGKGGEGGKKESMAPSNQATAQMPPGAQEYYKNLAKSAAENKEKLHAAIELLKHIPDKYTDPEATELKYTSGSSFDITITSK